MRGHTAVEEVVAAVDEAVCALCGGGEREERARDRDREGGDLDHFRFCLL